MMMVTNEETALAVWSATGVGLCWLVFILSMYFDCGELAYASSMILAVCFVMLTVANQSFAASKQIMCAKLATAFANIYCTMVCIVYFTNLTFVRLAESPSPEALSIVQFDPPRSAYFAIDQLGYCFMSLSVLCLAWSLPRNAFQWWLIFLGLWGATCIAIPLMPFQYETTRDADNSNFGVWLLTVYGLLFVPTYGWLAMFYRDKAQQTQPEHSATNENTPLLPSK